MALNNDTQYLVSLIIIISTWEPVVPLYYLQNRSLRAGVPAGTRSVQVSVSQAAGLRPRGRPLALRTAAPRGVLFSVTRTPHLPPSRPAHHPLELWIFLAQREDPEPIVSPSHPHLCRSHGTESMFIACMLVKLRSSHALAMFRFKLLYNFFFFK